MGKYNAGLHKNIKSIFGDMPIPKNQDTKQTSNPALPAFVIEPGDSDNSSSRKQPQTDVTATSAAAKIMPSSHIAIAKPQSHKVREQVSGQITGVWQKIKVKLFSPDAGVNPVRQKVMSLLVPILLIVFIFVLKQLFSTSKSTIINAAALGPGIANASLSDKVVWQIPEPYPSKIRDPMQPSQFSGNHDSNDPLIVKGILYSTDHPSAIIGNTVVYVGSKVFEATIVKITENSVEFEKDGKKWTQKVQP